MKQLLSCSKNSLKQLKKNHKNKKTRMSIDTTHHKRNKNSSDMKYITTNSTMEHDNHNNTHEHTEPCTSHDHHKEKYVTFNEKNDYEYHKNKNVYNGVFVRPEIKDDHCSNHATDIGRRYTLLESVSPTAPAHKRTSLDKKHDRVQQKDAYNHYKTTIVNRKKPEKHITHKNLKIRSTLSSILKSYVNENNIDYQIDMTIHAIDNNKLMSTQDAHSFLDNTLLRTTISNDQCNQFIDYVSKLKYKVDEDIILFNKCLSRQSKDQHNIDNNIENTVQFETDYVKSKRYPNLETQSRKKQKFENENSQIYGPSKIDEPVNENNCTHSIHIPYTHQPWGPSPEQTKYQKKKNCHDFTSNFLRSCTCSGNAHKAKSNDFMCKQTKLMDNIGSYFQHSTHDLSWRGQQNIYKEYGGIEMARIITRP